jgi:hypothetical protein
MDVFFSKSTEGRWHGTHVPLHCSALPHPTLLAHPTHVGRTHRVGHAGLVVCACTWGNARGVVPMGQHARGHAQGWGQGAHGPCGVGAHACGLWLRVRTRGGSGERAQSPCKPGAAPFGGNEGVCSPSCLRACLPPPSHSRVVPSPPLPFTDAPPPSPPTCMCPPPPVCVRAPSVHTQGVCVCGGGGGHAHVRGGVHMMRQGTCERGGRGAHADGRGGVHMNGEGAHT